jgi:hypothetical protein
VHCLVARGDGLAQCGYSFFGCCEGSFCGLEGCVGCLEVLAGFGEGGGEGAGRGVGEESGEVVFYFVAGVGCVAEDVF